MTVEKIIDIPDRIKHLRELLKLNQKEMAERLNIQRGSLSSIERKKTKTVTDRVIYDICREFLVNESWLRDGFGEIFSDKAVYSLDEYASKNNLSSIEIEIVKGYMELSHNTRKEIINKFKNIIQTNNIDS